MKKSKLLLCLAIPLFSLSIFAYDKSSNNHYFHCDDNTCEYCKTCIICDDCGYCINETHNEENFTHCHDNHSSSYYCHNNEENIHHSHNKSCHSNKVNHHHGRRGRRHCR